MNKKHIKYILLSKLMTGLSLVLFLVVAINSCKLAVRYGLNEDSTNLKKENKAETKTLKDLVNLIINYLPMLAKDNMLFATDNQGRNIIHHAVLSNHIDILKILLENSINYNAIYCLLNAKDHDGYIPLQLGTKNSKVEAVRLLSKDVRVDVNTKTKYGATPLCIASYLGHLAVVRVLLEMPGILVNAKQQDDCTPLHMAVYQGHVAVVRVLLEASGILVQNRRITVRPFIWQYTKAM